MDDIYSSAKWFMSFVKSESELPKKVLQVVNQMLSEDSKIRGSAMDAYNIVRSSLK